MSDAEAKKLNDPPIARKYPQKRLYRQRAHVNPISDHDFDVPNNPDDINWKALYPKHSNFSKEEFFVDAGCGYGGLLVALATLYPEQLMLGIELRTKVADFVQERIASLRESAEIDGKSEYQNIACVLSNAMKFLPNYFHKAQVSKMFLLYPDPHFKKSKHKWRFISQATLPDISYVIKPGGHIYLITDVEDLFNWMVTHLCANKLFRRLSDKEVETDPISTLLKNSSEEGKKVERNSGSTWSAIFLRIPSQEHACC